MDGRDVDGPDREIDANEASRVVDLSAWRREHAEDAEDQIRLQQALDHLQAAIEERRWLSSPPWLVTELLAIQGCLSMELVAEAAWRIERLAQKVERGVPASQAPAR